MLHDLVVLLLLSTITISFFFFFNDTATTEIYTLSLHDALPICFSRAEYERLIDLGVFQPGEPIELIGGELMVAEPQGVAHRSEEHTSELQSQSNLVCRLLLEKKKQ